MSNASLHNDFGELDKMQVNIQGVAHDLRQIEQVDSRLYSNEDTQRVMQELGSTRTDNNSFANFVSSRWVYYINFKTCLYFDFHSWVHELLMSLKTWASGRLGKRGSALSKQNLRLTCPMGKVEFKYFSSPGTNYKH